MLLFVGMHQELRKQKAARHQAAASRGDLASELKFRTSSVIAAQGTVASPGPVAGLGVTRAAPDAVITLPRLLAAVN
jgi:hypothetical protein